MSQTNTDYLFQAIPTGSERAPGPGRMSHDASGFDEHLSHASPSVFDVVRPANRAESTAEARRADRDRLGSTSDYDNGDAGIHESDSVHESNEYDNDASRSADNDVNSCESSSAKECTDEEHRDSDDAGDDESAATVDGLAAAASGQPASTQPPEPSDAQASTDETTAKVVADDTPLGKTAATAPSATLDTDSTDSAKQDLTIANGSTVDGAAIAVQEQDALASKVKPVDENAAAPSASHQLTADKNTDAAESDPTVPGPTKIASDAAVISLEHALTSPNADSSKEALAGEAAKPTDADSRRRTRSSARSAITRNDTEPSTAKPDAPSTAGTTSNIATPAVSLVATNEKAIGPTKPGAAKAEARVGSLTNALRAATEMTRSVRHTETAETPQVDPARFIGRVAKAFHTAQERGGTLQLRLSPPELGALKLQLTVKDGVLSAALETESADTRRLLLDHLPALRDRLAEQNIRVDRFDVDVRQDQNREQSNPRGMNQNANQQQPERPEPKGSTTTGTKAKITKPLESPSAASRIGNSTINLVV